SAPRSSRLGVPPAIAPPPASAPPPVTFQRPRLRRLRRVVAHGPSPHPRKPYGGLPQSEFQKTPLSLSAQPGCVPARLLTRQLPRLPARPTRLSGSSPTA